MSDRAITLALFVLVMGGWAYGCWLIASDCTRRCAPPLQSVRINGQCFCFHGGK